MIKILIAHPDEKTVELYKFKFKNHFMVDSAQDGLLALRKIKLGKPRVILSVEKLPVISAFGLLKFIRSSPQFCNNLFILLGDAHNLATALSLGANDWIDHPVSADLILEKVYYHLKLNPEFFYV